MQWTQKSGYSFGTLEPSSIQTIPLPVTDDSGFSYSVISGSLPPGLRIVGNNIVGTPFDVARLTTFTFCIRATNGTVITDRTFTIAVDNPYVPEFTTVEGLLPIGVNDAYFILDSSFVDFQIGAVDSAVSVGRVLKYFIASGDGTLPPGLTLTPSGKLTGFIKPATTIKPSDGDGNYDEELFDDTAYDFGVLSDNGYESFAYDDVFFDYSLPTAIPQKLDRNYEFIVSITDGDVVNKRKFRIYVIGDTTLRADNTTRQLGDGFITADNTYLRAPVWITPADLGIHRANNYVTLILDTYEAEDLGPVLYNLETVNPDMTPSELPPGLEFDVGTSEVFGIIPYQPAITKTYNFTVSAIRYGNKGDTATTKRTFTIQTLGEVESVMNWTTGANLGSISANYISTLKVSATSTVTNATVLYTVQAGQLPPGLTLKLDGEIVGKVNQFGTVGSPGILTFDNGALLLDGGTTTVDRTYSFVIKAQDQFGYSSISRKFTLAIDTPNDKLYSNIIAKTFMHQDKRAKFNSFINDSTVFTASSIYRPNDANFGLQKELRMTVYNGIETKTAAEYISAIGLNHKRKRFTFGSIKSAKAKITGTNDTVYEVIYVEMFDPLEKGTAHLTQVLTRMSLDPKVTTVDSSNAVWNGSDKAEPFMPRPDNRITIDQTNLFASDNNVNKRYPSSISIWRDRIKNMPNTASERNYLPLWMRSIQDNEKQELGFVLAVPICYCKPGTSADILLNIKHSGFDFKDLDYTVDRYIIDSVTGDTSDKYLVFKDDKVTLI